MPYLSFHFAFFFLECAHTHRYHTHVSTSWCRRRSWMRARCATIAAGIYSRSNKMCWKGILFYCTYSRYFLSLARPSRLSLPPPREFRYASILALQILWYLFRFILFNHNTSQFILSVVPSRVDFIRIDLFIVCERRIKYNKKNLYPHMPCFFNFINDTISSCSSCLIALFDIVKFQHSIHI